MEEKEGYLYIWWSIDDNQFNYYCNKYDYLGCVLHRGNLALKFRV